VSEVISFYYNVVSWIRRRWCSKSFKSFV